MDSRTMYMCMEIIALINLLRGKIAPPLPKKKKKKKKKRYTCSFFSKCILDITVFGHHKCSDTLFFLKRYLFNVPYTSRHLPYRVFLLSVNVRTPKTCPLFLIKPLFFRAPDNFLKQGVTPCFKKLSGALHQCQLLSTKFLKDFQCMCHINFLYGKLYFSILALISVCTDRSYYTINQVRTYGRILK